MSDVTDLARQADQLMQTGRLDEAAKIWERVLAISPEHPRALLHLGQHLHYRQNPMAARPLLERAGAADPKNPVVQLNLSFVLRSLGDTAGEMAALTRALTIDPYFLPALLAKAGLLERLGKRNQAARVYNDALTIAPPPDKTDAWLAKLLDNARQVVAENRRDFDAFLESRLTSTRARHAGENLERFDECKDVMTGTKKVYVQQPTMMHFPRLPAIAFYDTKDFPWLAEIEAATDVIREELVQLLQEQDKDFEPYVNHPDGVPLNQWAELNRSPKWSVYFLWSDGRRVDAHCARCPRTAALLDKIPMARVPGAAPSAFFSVLAPNSHIPPHTGVTNTRLIVHLPLIVPAGCWYRVGNEMREWKPGSALVFDDTMEHEAHNGSNQPRVVLIFDIWNPFLSGSERELVCELLEGYRAYYGENENQAPA